MIGALLEVAVDAARRAGALQRRARTEGFTTEAKGESDLVTAVDLACERAIVEALRARFPDHGVVAEEGTGQAGDGRYVWFVDPLDGTKNFAHGSPLCGVSIAAACDGDLLLGVVYAPFTDELFTAVRGRGAHCNGEPLRVSTVDTLAGALVGSALTRVAGLADPPQLARLARVFAAAQGLRSSGCAALDLADVARGRLDAFFEPGLAAWDTAAGALLVREAGGAATGFDGAAHVPGAPDLVASNGALHADLRALLWSEGARP